MTLIKRTQDEFDDLCMLWVKTMTGVPIIREDGKLRIPAQFPRGTNAIYMATEPKRDISAVLQQCMECVKTVKNFRSGVVNGIYIKQALEDLEKRFMDAAVQIQRFLHMMWNHTHGPVLRKGQELWKLIDETLPAINEALVPCKLKARPEDDMIYIRRDHEDVVKFRICKGDTAQWVTFQATVMLSAWNKTTGQVLEKLVKHMLTEERAKEYLII